MFERRVVSYIEITPADAIGLSDRKDMKQNVDHRQAERRVADQGNRSAAEQVGPFFAPLQEKIDSGTHRPVGQRCRYPNQF